MRLADAAFVVLDTETTHRDAAQAEIVEVAALLVDGHMWPNGEGAIFESLVFNERPLGPEVSGVHGLTDADLANAPRAAEVERRLAEFIPADAIVVAHNGAEYDFPLLRRVMPAALTDRATLCTERLARHVDESAPNYKLSTLLYRYGHAHVDMGGHAAHRALGDVLVLRHVLGSLIARYGAVAGDAQHETFTTNLVDLAASPIEMKTFPFGKYRDGLIAECTDVSYLMWCLANMDLRPDMRWTLERRFEAIVASIKGLGKLTDLAHDRNATEWHRGILRARYAQIREQIAA